MTDTPTPPERTPLRGTALLVLAGIVAVALNLRAAITAVGPLVPVIRADLDVSNVAMGAIGTVPVAMFGAFAAVAAAVGRRVGTGRALAGSMAAMALAIGVRSAGGYGALLVGTTLLGMATAVANVLVPALVKAVFPQRVGTLTSVYGALMVVGATVSAGVAVPLATARGWELSLGVWALPAALAAAVVYASVRADDRRASPAQRAAEVAARRADASIPARLLHRSAVAWHVTAYMCLQSLLFFVALAWLPDVLIERGMDDAAAGGMLSILNVGGLVGVLTLPSWAGRHGDQRWFGAAAGALTTVGLTLFLLPGTTLAPVASFVFGVGSGGTVGLALTFFSLRTATPRHAAAVSGMAQTWGYLLSALGPIGWGALRDLSGSWTPPLLLLTAVGVATTVAGHLAGRDRVVALPTA